MEFDKEQKDRMGLSDDEAELLCKAVAMIRSKPKKTHPGHLGAMMFTVTENPQNTLNMLMNFIKYTVENFAKDDKKVEAAEDIVSEFQQYVAELQKERASV